MKNKLSLHKVGDRYAIIQEITPKTEKLLLKKGDKMINIKTGDVKTLSYEYGSFGFVSFDGAAFLYLRPHHWKIVKYITNKDLNTLINK